MSRITQLTVADRRLSPAEAEIWVAADADDLTPATELRGRFVGPTCAYSTTIEVAYPLREFANPPPGLPPLARRVAIPEPSFWGPVTPFLYQGMIELWRDGRMCERRLVRHGFRDVRETTAGLTWNGRPLTLNAVDRPDLTESELPGLRATGVNALVLSGDVSALWSAAERLGFVVVGRTDEPRPEWLALTSSPACLGWQIPTDAAGPAWDEWRARVVAMRRLIRSDRGK